jgi:hypothetical protein
MTLDFKAAKDRKDGNVTPRVLRESMDDWIDDYDDLEEMIVIYEHDEGIITRSNTNMEATKLIGLLEAAKQTVLDDMKE